MSVLQKGNLNQPKEVLSSTGSHSPPLLLQWLSWLGAAHSVFCSGAAFFSSLLSGQMSSSLPLSKAERLFSLSLVQISSALIF